MNLPRDGIRSPETFSPTFRGFAFPASAEQPPQDGNGGDGQRPDVVGGAHWTTLLTTEAMVSR